jgi:hypothetical protein
MMDTIYSQAMKTVYDRSTICQKLDTIADIPMAKFQGRLKTSRRYQVFPSGSGIAQVEDPENGRK